MTGALVQMGKLRMIFWIAVMSGLLCGCDPVTTHKITSTIFDGVPSLPPAEQYCREYHERATAEEQEAARQKKLALEKSSGSEHPPYTEKRCSDCHDKNTDSGFVRPLKELCALCHSDLITGSFIHGPAAVGSCLKCHAPHNSPNPRLLNKTNGSLCGSCHNEQRLTQGMHGKVLAKGMTCTDCHDPHSGNNRFFLK